MPKPTGTLSEAFLKTREFLWDGDGNLTDVIPRQQAPICYAAIKASAAGAITLVQCELIKDIIQSRLGSHSFVVTYVSAVHGAINPSRKQIQDYRHAWLIELSKEVSNV